MAALDHSDLTPIAYSINSPISLPPPTALYVQDSGVVFEIRSLRVSMKLSMSSPHTAEVVLNYTNRLRATPFTLKASPQSTHALNVRVQPEHGQEVPPRKQVAHHLTFTCLRPFEQPVAVPVSFLHSRGTRALTIHVPITLGRFIVGQQLDSSAFMSAWKYLASESRATRRVDPSHTGATLAQLAVDGLHLQLVMSVETTPANFVAAGVLHTASLSDGGAFVTLPVLMRVQTTTGKYRATVHTGHVSVSEAVLRAFALITASEEVTSEPPPVPDRPRALPSLPPSPAAALPSVTASATSVSHQSAPTPPPPTQGSPAPSAPASVGKSQQRPDAVELPYQHDGDSNGLFYHLGTRGGTQPWQNPCEAGLVTVTYSSLGTYSQPCSALVSVGDPLAMCSTKDEPHSWFCIDLHSACFRPSDYTLTAQEATAPRHWQLEGSTGDDSEWGWAWDVLDEHRDDDTLKGALRVPSRNRHTWRVQPAAMSQSRWYRYFRLQQTGANSDVDGEHRFYLCNIELYGELLPLVAAHPAAAQAPPPLDVVQLTIATPLSAPTTSLFSTLFRAPTAPDMDESFHTVVTPQHGQGLQISTRLTRYNEQQHLELRFHNSTDDFLRSFDLRLHDNFLGLAPAASLTFFSIPNGAAKTAAVQLRHAKPMWAHSMGYIHVAIKTPMGVFHFHQRAYAHTGFTEDGEVDASTLQSQWTTLGEKSEQVVRGCQVSSEKQARQRLCCQRVFFVAQRELADGPGLFFSLKLRGALHLLRLRLQGKDALVAAKSSDKTAMPAVLHAVAALLTGTGGSTAISGSAGKA